nr:hypothetical protein [Tanacetum cinerariifolium]
MLNLFRGGKVTSGLSALRSEDSNCKGGDTAVSGMGRIGVMLGVREMLFGVMEMIMEVARVTTFIVTCKSYGGEATVHLFRAFLTLGSAGARGVEDCVTEEIVSVVPIKGFRFFCSSRDENSSINAPNPNSFNDPLNIFTHPPQPQYEKNSCELCGNDSHYGYDCPPRFLLAVNISAHTPKPLQYFNYFCYDDDDYDYEESTIPLNEIVSQIPLFNVITTSPTILPIEDPEDSLIIGDEDLSTIPEKESDEFIKSSVKDLVPIPSESEDTSESDSECNLPSCDDFSPINVLEGNSVTFSKPLFDSNDNFTSSNDESLSDKDVSEDNVKIARTLFLNSMTKHLE